MSTANGMWYQSESKLKIPRIQGLLGCQPPARDDQR